MILLGDEMINCSRSKRRAFFYTLIITIVAEKSMALLSTLYGSNRTDQGSL